MLKTLSFNVPEYVVVQNYDDLGDLLDIIDHTEWETVSIRTDKKGSDNHLGNLPFFPNQDLFNSVVKINRLLRLRPDLIIMAARGIDTLKSQIAGKYMAETGVLEYFLGPGSIRSVIENAKFSDNRICHCNISGRPDNINEPEWFLILQMVRKTHLNFGVPFIVEWSIYPEPIGNKKERLILWEVG
jgi:hypothetical protein